MILYLTQRHVYVTFHLHCGQLLHQVVIRSSFSIWLLLRQLCVDHTDLNGFLSKSTNT